MPSVQRRLFLLGTAATSVAGLWPRSLRAAAASSAIIDAHCHIFNADDLPVRQFLEKVVIRSNPDFDAYRTDYGNAIQFLVRFATNWINEIAPNAGEELTSLRSNPTRPQPRTPDEIKADEIKCLTKLIDRLKQLKLQGPNFTFRERLVSGYLPGTIVAVIHREAFPDYYKAVEPISNADNAHDHLQWRASDVLAKKIYEEGNGPLSRYLRWALLLTRYRSELANELAATHGASAILATPGAFSLCARQRGNMAGSRRAGGSAWQQIAPDRIYKKHDLDRAWLDQLSG